MIRGDLASVSRNGRFSVSVSPSIFRTLEVETFCPRHADRRRTWRKVTGITMVVVCASTLVIPARRRPDIPDSESGDPRLSSV